MQDYIIRIDCWKRCIDLLENEVKTSAPCKVIIFGEHSVVYGYPAIVVALDARAIVKTRKREDELIRINSNNLSTSWEGKINTSLKEVPNEFKGCVEMIKEFNMKNKISSGYEIIIDSNIPIGTGLGSSAATAVAIAKSLHEVNKIEHDNEIISKTAYVAEKVYHGTPSGIDNTATTFGGLIYYKKTSEGPYFKVLKSKDLHIVIGNTMISRSTAKYVGIVRKNHETEKTITSKILEIMGDIAEEGVKAIQTGDVARVGRLMNLNQGLLNALGVSHEKLEKFIFSARDNGALGAKLTGAGGGGSMVAIAPDKETAIRIEKALQELGGVTITTKITNEGVRVENN